MISHLNTLLFASVLLLVLGIQSSYAQTTPTPDALSKSMVSSINAKNTNSVQALIHPQVVSYLRVTDPKMLDNITASLMGLDIPEDYKVGIVSIDELQKSGSGMAQYDKSTQTLTLMGSSAYYKVPPTHLMMLVVEKEKTVDVDGKQEKKIVKVPLTPTPLPIGQYEGNWYIVIAAGKK